MNVYLTNYQMKLLKHFIAAALVLLLPLVSCDPLPQNETPDTPNQENPDTQKEEVAPTVTLTAGEATTESLSFVLTPANATSVRYAVYKAGETLPTAEDLLTSSSGSAGTPADATVAETYVVSGLDFSTEYVVVAAAHNTAGYSDVVTLNMTTATPAATVTLTLVEAAAEKVVFSIASEYSSKVAYLVAEATAQTPDAAYVLENGVEADDLSVQYTVGGLTPETAYLIYAAALDLDGAGAVLSEALEFTTAARPVVAPSIGDFYYSDGTWSTELDQTKEPVAIVFYTGVATEFGDNQAYYKVKDGSGPMNEFHGYAVALHDADPQSENEYGVVECGVWWSFWDGNASPTGVSIEVDDFLGYTNTLAIQHNCIALKKEFSASQDSYPAAYYATRGYEEACPAPEKSSGWFLPSAYQLQYIWDQVYFNNSGNLKGWLEQSFEVLGDKATPMYRRDAEYWSSTEWIDSSAHTYRAYYVCFDSSMFQPGYTAWYNKNYPMCVRSVLAF